MTGSESLIAVALILAIWIGWPLQSIATDFKWIRKQIEEKK